MNKDYEILQMNESFDYFNIIDFAKSYQLALRTLIDEYQYETKPRGMKCREILNYQFCIDDVKSNLFQNSVRNVNINYLAGEMLWYLTGNNDLKFISKYSKFWKKIANDDGTLNSAYGNLIFKRKNIHGYTEWGWAIHSLIKDKDSRQSIMHFNTPDHLYDTNKDQVCTMFGQFFIRDNKLMFYIYMRSNDIIKGVTYDIPFFTFLQIEAYKILKKTYPELELGSYYHTSGSLHIYESDFKLAEDMLNNDFISDGIPATDLNVIDENGFCCTDVYKIINNNYVGDDKFLNWLKTNS
jgi:thymidylate synthase